LFVKHQRFSFLILVVVEIGGSLPLHPIENVR